MRAPTWSARLAALGNAVVPACARLVGEHLLATLEAA
jgi:site-specific DNA-cytosine methylase